MLIVRPIGTGASRYYAGSPEPGTWLGGGASALGLIGEVDLRDLGAVLAGRYPAGPTTSGPPTARRQPLGDPRHPRRRAGWDLTFAAPKGVSLVAALVGGTPGADLVGAHRAAVDEAMGFTRRHACWVHRDNEYRPAGEGLVAAQFHHATSAAGDPHLHTHVLVVNALRGEDGKWSAVASSPLWRTEREVEAIYRLALRHHVGRAGHHPRWTISAEGGADLADVPRSAVVAASRRGSEIAAHRHAGRETTGASAARAVTRSRRVGTDDRQPWRAQVAGAGFGTRQAVELLGAGDMVTAVEATAADGVGHRPTAADAERAGEALAAKASSFTIRDVIRALAATSVPGMTAADAERRAEHFCAGAIPRSPGRWTTERSVAADATLVDRVTARLGAGVGIVAPRRVEAAAAHRSLDDAGRSAVRHLLAGGRGVDVLAGEIGRDRLDAQATVLDVARRAWQASAFQVAVVQGGRRWEALAGLADERRLPAGERAQVLVVDRADRLPTAELSRLLDDAAERDAKVVLVEGGTLPRRARPLSDGLVTIGDTLGRLGPGRVDPSPAPTAAPNIDPGGRAVVGSGRDALAYLVDLWQGAAPGHRPLLVGAGPPEVAMLNNAVRTRLVDAGLIGGEAMPANGRSFQVGDRVLAVRSNQGAAIPAASLGTVTDVERGGRAMSVAWDGGAAEGRASQIRIERAHAGFIGYGWATTPALAATAGLEVAVLGAPSRAGPDPGRVKASTLIATVAARAPQRHPTLDAAVVEAGVAGSTADLGRRSGTDIAAEHCRLGALLTAGLPDHRGQERLRWLAEHRPSLGRWDALGQALEDRADVLAHATADRKVVSGREPAQGPRQARDLREPAYELGLG